MWPDATRLAVALLGDRLAVAAVRRDRLDAFLVEAENPAAALRAELDARGIRARGVALAVARRLVTVKPIELPAVGGEIDEMVRFELERHLPFAADDAAFDFAVLPADTDAPPAPDAGRRVLVAAADRHVVEGALRVAQDAHLRPSALTIASHGLLALVTPARGQRVVWVHRAGEMVDLLLLARGQLVLSRSLTSPDEATLGDEIRRSLALLRWRTCEAIWISGDLAAPLDPAAVALAWLGAPVTAPPYTARARRRVDALPAEGRGALELAVAAASLGRRARGLDLVPAGLRPRRVQALTAAMVAATIVLAAAALLAPGYRESRRLAAINAEIARLDPEVRAVESVDRELDRKRRLLQTIDGLVAAGVRPLPVLRDLTELVPGDAWLTTLSLDTKGVELVGQASAASALIPVLENSPRLERVEFASPVTRGRDREQFRIRATWEPGGATMPPTVTAAAPPPAAPARPAPAGPAAAPAGPAAPPAAGRAAVPPAPAAPPRPPALRPAPPPAPAPLAQESEEESTETPAPAAPARQPFPSVRQ
jgi:Tfp pilus assembly protein PilN